MPANTRDKLLRKIAKKNSLVKMLDDAFKQALDINRETSFVEVAMGRYNDQSGTKIETQINKLSNSFQEYDINAMNTRSTNRSGDRSWNRSFDRSSSKNNSFNSSQNSRSNYRSNSYPSNNDSYNRQNYSRDMVGTEITNNNQDMNRETKTTQTGMTIIKIEIGTTITRTDTGLTTEGDQTNINTTETNTKLKSSLNSQIKT